MGARMVHVAGRLCPYKAKNERRFLGTAAFVLSDIFRLKQSLRAFWDFFRSQVFLMCTEKPDVSEWIF